MSIQQHIVDLLRAIGQFAWSYPLEFSAVVASVTACVVGMKTLFDVLIRWERVGPRYQEFRAKLYVAFFRGVAAVTALQSMASSSPPSPSSEAWIFSKWTAIFGYFVWEVAGVVGDHKAKAEKEKSSIQAQTELRQVQDDFEAMRQEKELAEGEEIRLQSLTSQLRSLVSEQLQGIKRFLKAAPGAKTTLQRVRAALAPQTHIEAILEQLALVHWNEVQREGGPVEQNFRVGLYVEQDGRLVPSDAFDLATRRRDPFVSYNQHQDRFQLQNERNPSHAVRCVDSGEILIVSDCAAAQDFQYFSDSQKRYLRSLVAYPLAGFCPDGATPARAALLIDTDVAGHFREEDRAAIEMRIREFAVRLELEYALAALVNANRAPQGDGHEGSGDSAEPEPGASGERRSGSGPSSALGDRRDQEGPGAAEGDR